MDSELKEALVCNNPTSLQDGLLAQVGQATHLSSSGPLDTKSSRSEANCYCCVAWLLRAIVVKGWSPMPRKEAGVVFGGIGRINKESYHLSERAGQIRPDQDQCSKF
ncbi:hypothetical protein SADUNF_Sadunf07G0023600 [Salix dunnii]|uniref:Uncharacterized protein n=1 Tax=Salix dunnii TaxID=1413687 RepID=A0A835K4B7_9ROSI|nr:hypothetical protein SADUNF_Sadunf07G0023600 [Salix dunnii]